MSAAPTRPDRRTVLAGLGALALAPRPRRAPLALAVIGLNGRGSELLARLLARPEVRVSALCDVDEAVLARAGRTLREAGQRAALFSDHRQLLERADAEAVVLATPDHWHALQTLAALRARKHVYVEAPPAQDLTETRLLLAELERGGLHLELALATRASRSLDAALAWLRQGALGAPRSARAVHFVARASIGRVRGNQRVPDSIDYDLWCGPTPLAPLRRPHLHHDWRYDWNTGGGELGAGGLEVLDLARRALTSARPEAVTSCGGRYLLDDDGQTPNTQFALVEGAPAPFLFEVRGLPRDAGARRGDWSAGMETLDGLTHGVSLECELGTLRLHCAGAAVAVDRGGRELGRWDALAGDPLADWLARLRGEAPEVPSQTLAEVLATGELALLARASQRVGTARSSPEVQAALADSPRATEAFARLRLHLVAHGVELTTERFTLGPRLVADPAGGVRDHARASALLAGQHREPYGLPG